MNIEITSKEYVYKLAGEGIGKLFDGTIVKAFIDDGQGRLKFVAIHNPYIVMDAKAFVEQVVTNYFKTGKVDRFLNHFEIQS